MFLLNTEDRVYVMFLDTTLKITAIFHTIFANTIGLRTAVKLEIYKISARIEVWI